MLKINIINQLKTLYLSLSVVVVLPIIILISGKKFDTIAFIPILIYLIVPFVLYIQYLYNSLNILVDLDYTKNMIIYKKRHRIEEISFKSIVSIVKVCSFPEAEQRLHWILSDGFFYFQINLADNERIIIPCFVTMELDIPNVEQVVKPKFIAYIR